MKLSVIIPVYNSEKYLRECIDSVINQSYKNVEIILVDDGSTDSSPAICDNYSEKDPRIKVIHQKNARIGAARNRGIEIATGKLITFLDSDDFLSHDTYKVAIDVLIKNNAELVQWDLNFLPEEDCTAVFPNRAKSIYTELDLNNIQALNKLFEWKNMDTRFNHIWTDTHCIWTKLCKIELFEDLRFPEGKEYEDEMILHHLLYRSEKSVFINKRFTTYRLRNNSTVHTMSLQGRLDKIDAYLDRFNLICTLGDEKLLEGIAHDYLAGIFNCYLFAKAKKNKEIQNNLIDRLKYLNDKAGKYLNNTDFASLKLMIISPSLFNIMYSNYRKYKK